MQKYIKAVIIFLLSLIFLIQNSIFTQAQTQADTNKSKPSVAQGEKLYKKHCTQCHKLNQKLVGPALAGINERRPESWLIPWIKNSQKMVQSGDEYAVKIYNEYNQTIMPPMPLNDVEVKSVLAYIKKETQKSKEAKANKGAGKKTRPTNIYADGTILNDGVFKSLLFITALLFVVLVFISLNIFGKVLNLNNRLPALNWNKINAYAFSLFFITGITAIIYELNIHTQYLLPEAASLHGQSVDQLFMITLIITSIMFLVTQTLLFLFAYRYGNNNTGKKALYYPANDKLEIFWTTIPAISLSIMVIMGFVSWQNINSKAKEDAQIIEVYGYRFNWKFRYPGKDGELGKTDFTRTKPGQNPLALNPNDEASMDDIITNELHLPKNKQVKLKIRSRDVIHSVYLPHFRVQMYAQPGMNNTFKFTPTISSKEMQDKVQNNKFKYELACNQVCGAAHYNMKADVYVEKEAKMKEWLSKKTTFKEKMKQFNDE